MFLQPAPRARRASQAISVPRRRGARPAAAAGRLPTPRRGQAAFDARRSRWRCGPTRSPWSARTLDRTPAATAWTPRPTSRDAGRRAERPRSRPAPGGAAPAERRLHGLCPRRAFRAACPPSQFISDWGLRPQAFDPRPGFAAAVQQDRLQDWIASPAAALCRLRQPAAGPEDLSGASSPRAAGAPCPTGRSWRSAPTIPRVAAPARPAGGRGRRGAGRRRRRLRRRRCSRR